MKVERWILRLLVVLVLAGFFTFTAKVLSARGELARIAPGLQAPQHSSIPWLLALFVAVLVAALVRVRALASRRTLVAATVLFVASLFVGLATPIGHTVGATLLGLASAVLVAAALPSSALLFLRRLDSDVLSSNQPGIGRHAPWILWAVVTIVYSVFSMNRHASFGSGSWDMGCMIHNFYRASRFLDTTSTVLGDVDFLGDHFMIGIYLFAPIFWINSSGYPLLLIQSVSLAAAAPTIFLIARHHGANVPGATIVALATAFGFGMQSAAFFDSHEITVGFGFLCFGLLAFEKKQFGRATLLFALFALFKESLGAYVVALGLLAIARGIQGKERRSIAYGAGWIAGGVIWFVLVNRVFMPLLIARANAPERHETFADFGPTVFAALIAVLKDPLRAASMIFVPDEKIVSLAVTFLGTGGLAFLCPELGIAIIPLIAERFLSSKQTMWEMGYHYAAPMTLYAGWGAAIAWTRAKAWMASTLEMLNPILADRAPIALGLYVLASTALIDSFGYRHVSNFIHPIEPYFSTPAKRDANRAAVELVKNRAPITAKVSAQNQILPHLADRPFIYRIGEWEKADWIVLSIGESAWPYSSSLPQQLSQMLPARGFRILFSRANTLVLIRRGATDLAPEDQSP